jgi:hypothetical protein
LFSKINYHIQTDAVKNHLIVPSLTQNQKSFKYANEDDLLNVALFGKTAADWRKENPNLDGNLRDYSTATELLVLGNMESYNAEMIKEKLPQSERIEKLNNMAKTQLQVLLQLENNKLLLGDGEK